jgi:hypothetical protein
MNPEHVFKEFPFEEKQNCEPAWGIYTSQSRSAWRATFTWKEREF